MKKTVKEYYEVCFVCKRNKTSRHKSYDQLQFLFIFEYKWNDLFMNFVIDLSNNRDYTNTIFDLIFVIVCRLTKMIHYISCIKNIFFKNFTDIFIRKIIRLHDFFLFIMTDKEFVFTSRYWSFLCYAFKIIRKFFIAFYFQINDQTKRINNVIKQYLRIYYNFEQNNWIANLFMTKFAYNNVINAFTKMFSFMIVQNFSFRMSFEHTSNFKIKLKFVKKHVNKLQNLMKVLKKI